MSGRESIMLAAVDSFVDANLHAAADAEHDAHMVAVDKDADKAIAFVRARWADVDLDSMSYTGLFAIAAAVADHLDRRDVPALKTDGEPTAGCPRCSGSMWPTGRDAETVCDACDFVCPF